MSDTRSRLVDATVELFRRRGYRGTALKDVVTDARATTGSLYHFFPDGKSALGAAVVRESGAAYQGLFELVADAARSPAQAIGDFFEGAATALEEDDFIDLCPIGTVAAETASSDEAIRVAADAVFASWIGAMETHLRAAGIHRDRSRQLATVAVVALQGAFIVARCRRDAEPIRSVGRWIRADVERQLAAASGPPPKTRS